MFLRVPVSKNDANQVLEILQGLKCKRKAAKLQRLGKNTNRGDQSIDPPNLAHHARPREPHSPAYHAQQPPSILSCSQLNLIAFVFFATPSLST